MVTYQDEDPPPAIIPNNSHVPNSVREEATESARQGRAREEERDAVLSLAPLVPHGEVVYHAGKESTLGDTEEEARDEEAGKTGDDAHQSGDDSPCHC